MQFKPRSTPPPRPDELSEIVRLLAEVKASLTRLAKDTTQLPATQELQQGGTDAKWTPA